MGIVLRFPHRHARASSVLRAAKAIKVSALTLDLDAADVANIGDHQSAGTLSRCHHLETADGLAPISEAIASREGQSSIKARKVSIRGAMPEVIGPIVLKRKANLSLDGGNRIGHAVPMSEADLEIQFKQDFTGRVKAAREAAKLTQETVAKGLGIPQDRYKQYEGRSYLPPHLYERFCIVCRCDLVWLITGSRQKPIREPRNEEQSPPATKRSKRRVA